MLLGLAALAAATIDPAQGWWAARSGRAVVLERTAVGRTAGGVELDPGEMVRLLESRGDQVRIAAGRVAAGWVPARSIGRVVPIGGSP